MGSFILKTIIMDMLLGQKLLKKSGEVVNADEALSGKKIICYYFSAHWCPPCRNFTPILSDFYTELAKDSEEPLEVIFVSSDNSPEELMAYMNELHGEWLAVQHGAVLAEQLMQKYEVNGIPTLIAVSIDGQMISKHGRSEVKDKGPKAFQLWLQSANHGRKSTRASNAAL